MSIEQFMPASASDFASQFSQLTLYLLVFSVVCSLLIFFLMILFCIRYRRRTPNQLAQAIALSYRLEIAWTVIPFALILVPFFWGAKQFLHMSSPLPNAEPVYVFAKQWMWKFEHADGLSEINALHVPVGANIDLVMISQDVIHSFFVPAFRVKFDVLPGRYTRAWFRATEVGEYQIFCSQYCGTDHSQMTGKVLALSPPDYEKWRREMQTTLPHSLSSLERGKNLFAANHCASCHDQNRPDQVAPSLSGVFGSAVELTSGAIVRADESYIRRSILEPNAEVVRGFTPVMPSYAGHFTETEIADLTSYIRSIPEPGKKVSLHE